MNTSPSRVVLRVWSSTSEAAKLSQKLFVDALGAVRISSENIGSEAIVLEPGVKIVWHTPETMTSQLRKLVHGTRKSAAMYSTVMGAGVPIHTQDNRQLGTSIWSSLGPIFQAEPKYQCQLFLENDEASYEPPKEGSRRGMRVHELALGLGSQGEGIGGALDFFDNLVSTQKTRIPGLFNLASSEEHEPLYVRLIPSNQTAIILAPPDGEEGLNAALRDFDQIHKGNIVPLGKRGGGSIRHAEMYGVMHPTLAGLDVRLISSTAAISPCFPERSVTEGAIPELQSKHVNRGAEGAVRDATLMTASMNSTKGDSKSESELDSKRPEGQVQFIGDCWMEFRAMLRRPGGFFRNER